MSKFKKYETGIKGLLVLEPKVYEDDRGFFMEAYNKNELYELGIKDKFVQENHSKSAKGVLRGIHYQKKYPQTKLARVIKGEVYDVAIDLRKDSLTYGNYYGIILSETNKLQFYIPKGFGHGMLVLSEGAEFVYKCDEFYHPEDEEGLLWNDSKIAINWPLDKIGGIDNIIQSEKDKNWPSL